ncbi:MAG TPA: VOC family protein [Cytophaga sp.]|jgi:predicted 3-demethylubiquinone-9 3-methyltransferase (glyoxalase superfamily)|nr:VOC family protein [Cytophaga sp.]
MAKRIVKKTGSNITPFLWFDGKVEEAVKFYTSIFKNSKIVSINRLGGGKGKVMTATFILDGQKFMALDGGPNFKFSPAVSFFVDCDTQKDVDTLWTKLSKGGKTNRCGWLDDKFGITWQIIPRTLGELLYDKDPIKSQRVMQAMLKMDKIIVADLKKAYNQK